MAFFTYTEKKPPTNLAKGGNAIARMEAAIEDNDLVTAQVWAQIANTYYQADLATRAGGTVVW